MTRTRGTALGLYQGTETHGQALRVRRRLAPGQKTRNEARKQPSGDWAPRYQTYRHRCTPVWESAKVHVGTGPDRSVWCAESLCWRQARCVLRPWTYLHLLLDIVAQQSVGLDALGQGQHHSVQRAPLCHLLMGFLISTLFTF